MQSHEDITQYEKYEENYSEDEFWKKLKGIPRSALGQVLEKALLLRELLFDSDTPLWVRGTVLGVLGYLILPIDIIPDVIPGVGFVDDLAVMGLVLANLDYMVPLVLHKDRFVLGNELLGKLVPMILVVMGHDDRIHRQDLVHGNGQFNCGVGQMIIGCSWESGECSHLRQHWIYEKTCAE